MLLALVHSPTRIDAAHLPRYNTYAEPKSSSEADMNYQAFKNKIQDMVPLGMVFQNPGGGTSEVLSLSDEAVSYRRGKSRIYVSLLDLFDAYWAYRGSRVSS